MDQTNTKNNIVENIQEPTFIDFSPDVPLRPTEEIFSTSIDSSLKTLITEAEILFKLLDNASNAIRHFEKSMNELKAFFSFRLCLKKEEESSPKNLADYHKDLRYAESFSTQLFWYLAWEPLDENSKNYRLFLMTEEKEILHCPYEDGIYRDEFQSKNIFKKALIETDIQTRLEYVEYLNCFINRFQSHLAERRLSIGSNRNVANNSPDYRRNRY